MSHSYRAVGWNRQKIVYDSLLAGGVALYLAVFVGMTLGIRPNATVETALIRGLGTAGFLLLHLVLCVGPLARLHPGFLPLLYNRRHLGVVTFLVGLAHAALAIFQFHALGDRSPLVSLLVANPRIDSVSQFPFELLGLGALVVLFLMAATSHDFWLANLTAPVWKALHMGVYGAYVLLVGHVALGALQSETRPWLAGLLAAGAVLVGGLHVAAGWRERAADREVAGGADGLVQVCRVDDIPDGGARVATVAGERVAVFRYGGRLVCVSSVCQHQNGPLGEGRVVDGYITCPWHGYQYCPETGASPEPFPERIPTFPVSVRDGRVFVRPTPAPLGTRTPPAVLQETP